MYFISFRDFVNRDSTRGLLVQMRRATNNGQNVGAPALRLASYNAFVATKIGAFGFFFVPLRITLVVARQ